MAETPPITDAQRKRIDNWLSEVNTRASLTVHWHDLHFLVREEIRPGRGHDLSVVYLDGDIVENLTVDVYGNGDTAYGSVDLEHWGGDGCECTECEKEREE